MYEYRNYNHSFQPIAKLSSLSWGCRADWYIPENVDACKENVPYERFGNRMWPRGWFACVEYYNHDDMRDFHVNEREEMVIAGPFPTEEEALEYARWHFDEVVERLS